jgi:hypothetical protein
MTKTETETESEFRVSERALAILESPPDVDHSDRVGLDIEYWARNRPDVTLRKHRTRSHDAIKSTGQAVEIKACQYWANSAGTPGTWQLRRPQHEGLTHRTGTYLLVVYRVVPPHPDEERRLVIEASREITPAEVQAHCNGFQWRTRQHDSLGYHLGVDVPWPTVVDPATTDLHNVPRRQ